MTPPWRETVRKFAQEHFKNPAWGYSHSERDYRLARTLAAEDGAKVDDDVLYAAAYLHDIGAFAPWANPKLDHEDIGAADAASVLKGTGFPMDKLDGVRNAIRTHMYYRTPVGPEAMYLHDADALDWLGAIGAARIIALVDPNGGTPTGPAVIPMLEANLSKVPAHVLTPAGRKRLPGRKAELARFLGELRRESENYSEL